MLQLRLVFGVLGVILAAAAAIRCLLSSLDKLRRFSELACWSEVVDTQEQHFLPNLIDLCLAIDVDQVELAFQVQVAHRLDEVVADEPLPQPSWHIGLCELESAAVCVSCFIIVSIGCWMGFKTGTHFLLMRATKAKSVV